MSGTSMSDTLVPDNILQLALGFWGSKTLLSAVERDRKAAIHVSDASLGIEALPLGRARAAPRCLLRVKRRFSGYFIEQFTHRGFRLPLVAANCETGYASYEGK